MVKEKYSNYKRIGVTLFKSLFFQTFQLLSLDRINPICHIHIHWQVTQFEQRKPKLAKGYGCPTATDEIEQRRHNRGTVLNTKSL